MIPLATELASTLDTSRSGITFVRHPLVCGIYIPELNHTLNRSLESKKLAVAKALEAEDYEMYVFLHERPFRVGAYRAIEENVPLESARELLIRVWTDQENPGANRAFFLQRFKYLRQPEAYKKVEQAVGGETFKLYRGVQREERTLGLSWTTECEKAIWFARRFRHRKYTPVIYTLEYVHWNAILAYIDDRGESEVIVNTSWPNIRKNITVEIAS